MEHLFCVATDASNFSICGILYQIIANEYRYIGFTARSLPELERNYSTTKRELFSVVYMLQRYHQFLWGHRFTLYTDHKSLCYIYTQTVANPMMIGWFDTICDYTFDVIYCPSVKNVLSDTLSRLFESLEDSSTLVGGNSSKEPSHSNNSSSTVNATQVKEDKPEYMTSLPVLLSSVHLLGHFGTNSIVITIHNDGYHWVNIKQEALELVNQCPECRRFNIGKHGYLSLRSIKADSPGNQ